MDESVAYSHKANEKIKKQLSAWEGLINLCTTRELP